MVICITEQNVLKLLEYRDRPLYYVHVAGYSDKRSPCRHNSVTIYLSGV